MASSVCLKGDIWYVSNVTLEAKGNLGRCRQGCRCTLTSENTTTSYANSRGNSFLNEFKIERTLHDIWRWKIESHENISVEYGGVLRQKETSNYLWLLLFSWVLQKETSKTEKMTYTLSFSVENSFLLLFSGVLQKETSFSTSACWHVRLDKIVNTFYHILIISLVLRCEKGVWNREPFFFEKGLCFKKRAHIEVKSRGSRAA